MTSSEQNLVGEWQIVKEYKFAEFLAQSFHWHRLAVLMNTYVFCLVLSWSPIFTKIGMNT